LIKVIVLVVISARNSKMEKKWFVYILECMDGSYYTGVTNNLELRMKAHSEGKGSKYVWKKGFKELLRARPCENKSQACKFEYEIKQLARKEKLSWFDEEV
jgi:putative endonuclease